MILSDLHMNNDSIRVNRLIRTNQETEDITTITFSDKLCSQATPGQYIMIWVPGVREIPMSLSTISSDVVSVTIRSVGDTTRFLSKLKKDDKIGVRGPFGKGYTILGDNSLLVAGGVGVASLKPLVIEMVKIGFKPTFVLGAHNIHQFLFRQFLTNILKDRLFLATDNGSYGYKGYASSLAREIMDQKKFDSVYTCGPELMMLEVFKDAKSRGIPLQASLERYIKCAVGLCGSCAIGPFRVCVDGPVFNSEQLEIVKNEFGYKLMDPSGIVRGISE